ncbi:MAG: hypothetical protein HY542_04440 [Deltaproteobacteria bacterium]|nr:hypothetical protein [Deltaproteobacteria bacterium]
MKRIFIAILLGLFLVAGCGGRVPSPKTSERVILKAFKKYGKKYKESDFGRYKVEKVEIENTEELQRGLASVEAFTYLAEGSSVYRVRVTLQKRGPLWRYQSWENLGKR